MAMSKQEFRLIKSVHGLPKDAIVTKMKSVATFTKMRKPSVMVHRADGTCPWLIDGKCSVYPLRPDTCRKYGLVPEMPCQYLYPKEAKEATRKLMQKVRQR